MLRDGEWTWFTRLGGVAVAMAALALAGCAGQADPTPSVTANRGDDGLTVGVLLSQTGYLKQFGVATTGGVMLAADDINGSGGVNGKPVALIVEDDGTDEQVAANKTEQLIAKNVSAIIGPNLSGTTLAVIDSIVKAGVIECSPSATSTQLTTYPDYGLFFRTAPPDTLQGEVLAKRVLRDGHKTASVIALDDAYGQGLAETFTKAYEAGGGKIVQQVASDAKGTNYDANTQAALQGNPQALMLFDLPRSGSLILQSLVKAGKGPANSPTYGADGLQANTLPGLVDPSQPTVIDGLIITGPPIPSQEFMARVRTYIPEAEEFTYSENAYDCLTLIALAAQAAKSNEPSQIAKFMVAVATGSTKCDTYATCVQLLDKGTEIQYVGASGPLGFTAVGEPSSGKYAIGKFVNGQVVIQEQVVVRETGH